MAILSLAQRFAIIIAQACACPDMLYTLCEENLIALHAPGFAVCALDTTLLRLVWSIRNVGPILY